MNEVLDNWKYQDFKVVLDVEIKEAAAGFVRIGYLLKIARDTRVLEESGYTTVADFAKAEYGLSKDVVSRYIAINDKYSENGYSDKLQERYQNFGVAKLAEMLTLPEAIAEELTPAITRNEIQEIKHELKEEQNTTELELMMETREVECENDLEYVVYEYMKVRENYKRFYEAYHEGIEQAAGVVEEIDRVFTDVDRMMEAIAPTGIANIRVKVPQIGRMMLNITGIEDDPVVVNMRTMEKETYSWDSIGEAFKKIYTFPSEDWKASYCSLYGDSVENSPVALVQLSEEAAEIQNADEILEDETEEITESEQAAVENEENSPVAPVQLSENHESTECEEDLSLEEPEVLPDQEDTATDEEERKNAQKLHTLKMLEKYYTFIMDDEKEIMDRILEDCKRRKREYGFEDVGSTL